MHTPYSQLLSIPVTNISARSSHDKADSSTLYLVILSIQGCRAQIILFTVLTLHLDCLLHCSMSLSRIPYLIDSRMAHGQNLKFVDTAERMRVIFYSCESESFSCILLSIMRQTCTPVYDSADRVNAWNLLMMAVTLEPTRSSFTYMMSGMCLIWRSR